MPRWLFPSGADGDTLTAPLAGADTIDLAGGTGTLSDDHSLTGTGLSALMTGVDAGHQWWAVEGLTSTAYAVDAYLLLPASDPPAGTNAYIIWGGASSSARSSGIQLRIDRTFRLLGNGSTVHWTSGTLPTDTTIRISVYVTCSATTGTLRVQWFDLSISDSTPQGDSGTITGVDTQTSIDRIRIGRKAASVAGTGAIYFMSWAYDVAATGLLAGWTPTGSTTGTLAAGTPATAVAVPTSAWSGTTSGTPEVTGGISATLPAVGASVPTSTWSANFFPPTFVGTLAVTPEGDAVTIEAPMSDWSGTATPGVGGGVLAASIPPAAISTPAAIWAGSVINPLAGLLTASCPAIIVATPAASWSGIAAASWSGLLIAALPAVTVLTPVRALTRRGVAHITTGPATRRAIHPGRTL